MTPRRVRRDDAGGVSGTRTPFVCIERRGPRHTTLAGTAGHPLVARRGVLRVRRKRVDLRGADAALPALPRLA